MATKNRVAPYFRPSEAQAACYHRRMMLSPMSLDEMKIARRPRRASDIDICIPVYKTDPTPLILQLAQQNGAERAALRIYDDGSGDPELIRTIRQALARFPGRTTLIEGFENRGRSVARNALLSVAESDWLLLLDCDMRLPDAGFLDVYRAAVEGQPGPCCIVGGFQIDPQSITSATRLHALQSMMSDCLPAQVRSVDPGRYVFTSNIFMHRTIAESVRFDEGFAGWGWEDVDWGLRIVTRYPVHHIDNPAVHVGLDTTSSILRKYMESVQNFLRMLESHPEAVARMPVYRWASQFSRLPGCGVLVFVARGCANAGVVPPRVRLLALKVYRAGLYGSEMHRAGH